MEDGTSGAGARMRRTVICVLLAAPCAGGAQEPDSLPAVECTGQIVTAVDIVADPPSVVGRNSTGLRRTVGRALFAYQTTRPEVVHAFLLLRQGDACTELLRRESERVLRAQPFLSGATVRAVADSAGGGVRLEVTTVDEIHPVVGAGFGDGISSLKLGSVNVSGHGLNSVAQWRQGGSAYRDAFGVQLRKHGLFDRPLVASLDLQRNVLGSNTAFAIALPFWSDAQRVAWSAGVQNDAVYRRFVREGGPDVSLRLDRTVWHAGGVTRVAGGPRGALAGIVASREHADPAVNGVIVTEAGLEPDYSGALFERYDPYTTFRLSAVLGVRLLTYMRAAGFDALVAEQDVAKGLQVGALIGRGLPWFGADDEDNFLSLDVYGGAGTPRSFVGMRIEGEGRRADGASQWSAIAASGRLAWYLKASERRTIEASAEFSGGWRERLPLQLALGASRAGVRGFQGSSIAGGRRAVLRLEQRRAIGALTQYSHWGVAAFADLGKTWAGSVPFGETTFGRASVGAGMLVAVPARSRRMLRLDIAVPVTPGAEDNYVVRFGATNRTRDFWRDPGDVVAARAAVAPSTIFGWR